MNNLDAMIEKLLDTVDIKDDNTIVFTYESKQLIHDISDKCKNLDIVKQNLEKSEEYAKDLTTEQIYIDMLHKIVAAPTRLHMLMSARMLIPVIDKKINEKGDSDARDNRTEERVPDAIFKVDSSNSEDR